MPTPDRTSLDQIVHAGREILESAGLAGLTMQAVAARVGVRAPSLYKRVRDRDALVRLIAEATVAEVGERLAALGAGADPRRDLVVLIREFRAFAHERPMAYQLMFTPVSGLDVATVSSAIEPVLRVAGQLAGEDHALDAARTLTAWVNGFIGMELGGAFQMGGDIEQAFEFGLTRLTAALAAR
ncbi:TetR/AcrR family transcriptional regulator [Dactylosporangium siamense]|uniref:TetR family transcriptional regulator n=1 Tax=Dactylosporangium siamense TaxID=685454 RepID=A0A919U9Q1_9ACTN|nr:TetR/AcrR family transcriptional regulator [Dactylosporangium siamense]GIG43975.1 TetR family transcriptional regulator [Dactylosporangium siamense]